MYAQEEGSPTRGEKVQKAKATLDAHLHELAQELQEDRSERLIRYFEFCA